MKSLTDCEGIPYPIFTTGNVTMCETVKGAKPEGSVYCVKIEVTDEKSQCPVPGQFYMLRSEKSQQLLARPISVFHAQKTSTGLEISFLILLKGKGTHELCNLEADDRVQVLGPLGNVFPKPESSSKVLIVGGGIGVAPVAGFAEILPEKSYDFIASFKSGSYGIENLKADTLTITTDDGSYKEKGFAIDFMKKDIEEHMVDMIFACGPLPMLKAVKKYADENNIKCQISLEEKMGCGIGACLGCAVKVVSGDEPRYGHVCKEGPVFYSTDVEI